VISPLKEWTPKGTEILEYSSINEIELLIYTLDDTRYVLQFHIRAGMIEERIHTSPNYDDEMVQELIEKLNRLFKKDFDWSYKFSANNLQRSQHKGHKHYIGIYGAVLSYYVIDKRPSAGKGKSQIEVFLSHEINYSSISRVEIYPYISIGRPIMYNMYVFLLPEHAQPDLGNAIFSYEIKISSEKIENLKTFLLKYGVMVNSNSQEESQLTLDNVIIKPITLSSKKGRSFDLTSEEKKDKHTVSTELNNDSTKSPRSPRSPRNLILRKSILTRKRSSQRLIKTKVTMVLNVMSNTLKIKKVNIRFKTGEVTYSSKKLSKVSSHIFDDQSTNSIYYSSLNRIEFEFHYSRTEYNFYITFIKNSDILDTLKVMGHFSYEDTQKFTDQMGMLLLHSKEGVHLVVTYKFDAFHYLENNEQEKHLIQFDKKEITYSYLDKKQIKQNKEHQKYTEDNQIQDETSNDKLIPQVEITIPLEKNIRDKNIDIDAEESYNQFSISYNKITGVDIYPYKVENFIFYNLYFFFKRPLILNSVKVSYTVSYMMAISEQKLAELKSYLSDAKVDFKWFRIVKNNIQQKKLVMKHRIRDKRKSTSHFKQQEVNNQANGNNE
jgi:hypothetical protein